MAGVSLHRVLNVFFFLAASLLLTHTTISNTVIRSDDSTGPPDPRQWFFHIRYAHLLVECTIASIEKRVVTLGQLHAEDSTRRDDSREVVIHVGQLSDVVVLRGSQTPREIYLPNGLEDDILGQRVVLCGFWVSGLRMYGAPFLEMVYLQRGDTWIELGRPLNAPDITMTSADLAELIRETQPATLARKADVIAVGRVSSTSDSSVTNGDAFVRVKRVRLRCEEVLKGGGKDNEIEFLVSRGFPVPAWRTKTPYEFHIGQRWFVFLAQNEDGFLYPLAGHNGLLLVNGQELIYDGAPYSYSRLSLTRTVATALRSDDPATSLRWDITRFGNQRPGSALRAADIVLHGRVGSVSTRKVRAGDVRSVTAWPTLEMDARIVRLEDSVRLKGGNEQREVLVDVTVHPERLIGKRVILCGQWRPKLDNYFVHSKSWVYVEAGDSWSRLDRKESLSSDDVRALGVK